MVVGGAATNPTARHTLKAKLILHNAKTTKRSITSNVRVKKRKEQITRAKLDKKFSNEFPTNAKLARL